jgi:rubrerythrin
MAAEAREEGLEHIAKLFEHVAKIEKNTRNVISNF